MKKQLSSLFVFCFLFPLITHSQNPQFQWAMRAGANGEWTYAYAVTHDSFGNVYVTGDFEGTVDFDPGPGVFNLTCTVQDFYLLKLDASGNFVWAKRIGGASGDSGRSLVIDKLGNVIVTGIFSSSADFDPGPGVFTLSASGSDIFILKLDNAGNFIWAKQFGGLNSAYAAPIKLDASGNIYTTGYFRGTVDFNPGPATYTLNSVSGTFDAFVLKLDANGNFIWVKQLGGSSDDFGRGLDIDAVGNIYSSGYFQGSADFDPDASIFYQIATGLNDVYVSKLDANGNFVWAKQLGGFNDDYSYALALDTLSNIYVSGWFTGNSDFDPGPSAYNLNAFGGNDVFITKLNTSGNFIWAKQLGGIGYDICHGMAIDQYNNVYTVICSNATCDFDPGIGTYSLSPFGNTDVFVSKLNSAGNFKWVAQIGGTDFEYVESVDVSKSGNVYTAGYFNGTVDFDPSVNTYTLSSTSGSLHDMFVQKMNNCETSATVSRTVCNSYVSPSGNYTWTAIGTYYDVVPNSKGCDSIIKINLSIKQNTSSITPISCDSYTSPSGNYVWTNSGSYTDTLTNVLGCDSIITINLTIKKSTSSTINSTACDTYLTPSNNYTLTNSGIYTDVISNSVGCDSVITINLIIKHSTSSTITPTVCYKYVSPSTNYTLTSSGTYTDVIPNSAGCDSIITINLITKNTTSTISTTACGTYTSPSGNYIWNSNGIYKDTIVNAWGCDSIILINLSIINIDNTITNSGTTLAANASAITYQWVDCDNGNAAITGEINQSFTPTISGNYAVVLSSGGCSKQSICTNVIIDNLNDDGIYEKEYVIYPNPTKEFLQVESTNLNEQVLELSNTLGQIVFKAKFAGQFLINMRNLPPSIYYLNIDNRGISKIVKE